MKKHRRNASDKVNRTLQTEDLVQVRGGSISGGGLSPDENGVIHMQSPIGGGVSTDTNGVIHSD
jgi:hypothetical protein